MVSSTESSLKVVSSTRWADFCPSRCARQTSSSSRCSISSRSKISGSTSASHGSMLKVPVFSSSAITIRPSAMIASSSSREMSYSVPPTILILDEGLVALGTAVPEELPGAAHLLDQIEVEVLHHQLVLVLAGADDDLAARIDEDGLAV